MLYQFSHIIAVASISEGSLLWPLIHDDITLESTWFHSCNARVGGAARYICARLRSVIFAPQVPTITAEFPRMLSTPTAVPPSFSFSVRLLGSVYCSHSTSHSYSLLRYSYCFRFFPSSVVLFPLPSSFLLPPPTPALFPPLPPLFIPPLSFFFYFHSFYILLLFSYQL